MPIQLEARPGRVAPRAVALALAALTTGCSWGDDGWDDPPRPAGRANAVARVAAPESKASRAPEVRDGDVIYAVAAEDDRLLAIDPKTALVSTVGHFGTKTKGMKDLVVAPDGGVIAASWEGHPALLRIDLKTGRATPGPRVTGPSLAERTVVEGLAVVGGVLYGSASNARSFCNDCAHLLLRIDPETGEATEVGAFGPQISNVKALAYSPRSGLIGADIGTLTPPDFRRLNTRPSLVRIDPSTARATRIGHLPPATISLVQGASNDDRLSPEGPYVCGLCYAPDGTLYASTFPTHFGGLSELFVVDPDDASLRRVGILSAMNINGMIYVRPPAPSAGAAAPARETGPQARH
jgi:hypothetical protein